MKTKCLALTIGIGWSMLLHAHSQMVTVLKDDFADGVVDANWIVSTTNTVNPFYIEQGGSLQIVTIPPEQVGANVWCTIQFSRFFQPVSEFDASFEIAWDSNGANSAMQQLSVVLYNPFGAAVATAGYRDSWVDLPGRKLAETGGSGGVYEFLPLAGASSVRVIRSNSTLMVLLDGHTNLTATVSSPIVRVAVLFEHYTYSGGSTFGRLQLADIRIDGTPYVGSITPHHAAELEWLGVIGSTYDIQASTDFETWVTIETGISGQNAPINRLISTRALGQKHGWTDVFFRHVTQTNPQLEDGRTSSIDRTAAPL